MVAKKKKNTDSINSRLSLVMKSGKVALGYKTTLKALRGTKAKLIILSNNLQPLRKSEIEYYAMLAKTAVHHYSGSASLPPRGEAAQGTGAASARRQSGATASRAQRPSACDGRQTRTHDCLPARLC